MINIRPAKIKDLLGVVKMRLALSKYHEAFDNDFRVNKNAKKYYISLYKKYIYSSKKKLLVVESKDKLVGFGSAHIAKKEPISRDKEFGHIRDMYIDKKFRRQGIAGEILNIFYNWFKEKNIKYIDLKVVCANKLGRNAWTKYGFLDYAIIKRKLLK
ncbi:MAG: GNAT family N-acetyltransferase [bacterium]|nr:GNAT family N-acetyltransferase [bacterium]